MSKQRDAAVHRLLRYIEATSDKPGCGCVDYQAPASAPLTFRTLRLAAEELVKHHAANAEEAAHADR